MEEYFLECKVAIDDFMEGINILKQNFNFSKTPKIPTIESHVLDFVKISKGPLRSLDQCIEALHQYFNKRMNSSQYKVKTVEKEIAGQRLMQCVLHINSYNLYS